MSIVLDTPIMSKTIRIENVYKGGTNFSVTVRNVGSSSVGKTELSVYKNGAPVDCTFTGGIAYGSIGTCSSSINCTAGDTIKVTSPSNSDIGKC